MIIIYMMVAIRSNGGTLHLLYFMFLGETQMVAMRKKESLVEGLIIKTFAKCYNCLFFEDGVSIFIILFINGPHQPLKPHGKKVLMYECPDIYHSVHVNPEFSIYIS